MSASGGPVRPPRAADREGWLANLDRIGEERGYFQSVGSRHSAIFTDEGPILLVTFEEIDAIRERDPDGLPLGFALADPRGWSQLCLLAHGATWYRDRAVFGYFDRLVDEGFFEDFDRVIFYGAGMGGYAAAAFSVAAPGSVVVAVQPQAALNRAEVEWDRRFRSVARADFTERYGYAPAMLEAADEAYLFYDPGETLDAAHAALFRSENVVKLRCRWFGDRIEDDLRIMGVLDRLMEAAGRGSLNAVFLRRALRVRHRYAPYLRGLLKRTVTAKRPLLTALICRSALRRGGGKLFRLYYRKAIAEISAASAKAAGLPVATEASKAG